MSIRMILAALAIALIVVSAPSVRADETSKEKIIAEIFDVVQYEKMFDQVYGMMTQQMLAQIKAQRLDMDLDLETLLDETWQELGEEFKKGFRPTTSRLWAKYYLITHKTHPTLEGGRASVEYLPRRTRGGGQDRRAGSGG